MYYVLTYRYVDQEARARVRPEHLAHLGRLLEAGSLVLAGPWADGEGAMIVYDAADEAAARAMVEADPYTREGASADRVLRAWNVVLPEQPA